MNVDNNYFHEQLTEREKEILQFISMGLNSQRIAKRLMISKNTVDTHRRNILKKTKLRSTFEIVMKSKMELLV
ncbi:MAG: response regulator transcription factor [Cyclobacteriaceae bacterium]